MAISQIGMTTAFSGRFNTLKEKKKKIHLNDKAEDKAVDFLGISFLENTVECSSSCGDTLCHLLLDILVLLVSFGLQVLAGL